MAISAGGWTPSQLTFACALGTAAASAAIVSPRRIRDLLTPAIRGRGRQRSLPSGGVAHGARRVEQLAGFEQGLEPGQDHGPTAVELGVRALGELVVRDREPARRSDRLDLPGDAGRALGPHLVAPESVE